MKEFCIKQGNNINFALLVSLSIAETVISALFCNLPIYISVLLGFAALIGSCFVRWAYEFSAFSNRWYSTWNRRKGEDQGDDEPSDWAVVSTMISGYMLMSVQAILLFISF
jgi:hypothetical protein